MNEIKKAKVYLCPRCGHIMKGTMIKYKKKFVRAPYVYCVVCGHIMEVDDEDKEIILERLKKLERGDSE